LGLRVRTLFLTLFLLVLLVPFVVLGVLRLFEEALIRETEEVLLAEAVVIGEAYRQQVAPVRALPEPTDDTLRFAPFVPRLELSGPILPPAKRGPTTTTVAPGRLDLMLERVIVRNLSGVRARANEVIGSTTSRKCKLPCRVTTARCCDGVIRTKRRRRFRP
jgi:hypothetical protein